MSFESPMKKKRQRKASDQADRQCIVHIREEAKGFVNRFLLTLGR